jgi:cell division protein FtsB
MKKLLQNRMHLVVYFIFFLFSFWIVYIIIYGNGGIIKRENMRRELQVLEEEIRLLKTEKQRLSWEIESLKTNRVYVEAYARELGFKKRGEVIFKFIRQNPDE